MIVNACHSFDDDSLSLKIEIKKTRKKGNVITLTDGDESFTVHIVLQKKMRGIFIKKLNNIIKQTEKLQELI